ncbi:PqiC family protein [Marinomonas ostreistagni]|uniref:Membrane integrity-associated transporter subunit PqiC n=1 Tax=Marinomonas ostreistagni TaxID=359209 RepID=A0ABS0ZB04_9GAMM|nr:PqiC family protein [Marinomonas ostreistagni]MBJ7550834.1 membrane integrity-associated transporter subunit PqiC [Marinomonas ostreistagni]
MRVLLVLIGIAILAGCSSQTLQPPKYYVLNGAPAHLSASALNQVPLTVRSVILSEYLQSSNIVLQVSDHELFFSANNLWAEPLQVGIKKALENNLSAAGNLQDASFQLDLNVDYFHIIDQDSVILSGDFSVFDEQGRVTLKDHFALRHPLNNSGYEYAVSIMSATLKSLSEKIAASINKNAEVLAEHHLNVGS